MRRLQIADILTALFVKDVSSRKQIHDMNVISQWLLLPIDLDIVPGCVDYQRPNETTQVIPLIFIDSNFIFHYLSLFLIHFLRDFGTGQNYSQNGVAVLSAGYSSLMC
jgi:hypothetical protein